MDTSEGNAPAPGAPRRAAAAVADPLPGEPTTELGYARRLTAVYGDRLRYVAAWRRWLVWDGERWAHDATGQSARWMKAIARRLTSDALALQSERERAEAIKLARRGESSAGVAGSLTLASTEPGIVVTPDDLDADPFLLNCPNGILDLRTGLLHPHDPARLLTKLAGAAYDPKAKGPVFAKFLGQVQPDETMRAFLARLLGHALDGRVTSHILPIFHGEGGNGKSTLVDAAMAALGDYADAADPGLLTARSFDAHPTGVADLCGLRLAILHETDAGRHLAEGTVKRLTGGDRLKARRMREDFWSFTPTHTFVMLTNHKPLVTGTDEGIWRRIRLIPWEIVIPAAHRDEQLASKLAAELPAILAWLTAGYRDWATNGLGEPKKVTDATAAYRDQSDALGRFITDSCVISHQFTAGSTDLYTAWTKWCANEGEEPGTQTAFATALQNKGLDKTKDSSGRMRWKGIGLTETL